MFIPESYGLAVLLSVITMLCWGSWANTQKLASKSWSFPLFYWDYSLGIILLTLVFGFTLGSSGEAGRGFLDDLAQGDTSSFVSAFIGGIVFNIANLLIVAAIDIAGMAVAFPIGIGIALVLGVTGCGDGGGTGGSGATGGTGVDGDCARICENPCVGEYLPPGAVDDCQRSCDMGFFTCIPELVAALECIEALGCDGSSLACVDESETLTSCLVP